MGKDTFSSIRDVQDLTAKIDPWMFAAAILVSLAAALAAGWLYARYYERRGTGSQIHRSFPLLGISITTLFICIQVSLPLSLGLLGALSIIRFRTPIKEPEEVGFIMLVVASSIVCATFNFQFLGILYGVVIVMLYVARRVRRRRNEHGDGIILVVLPGVDVTAQHKAVEACVRRHTRYCATESSACKEGSTSIQFSFTGFRGEVADLQAAMREAAAISACTVFFNRPAGME